MRRIFTSGPLRPESPITLRRNRRSLWAGIRIQQLLYTQLGTFHQRRYRDFCGYFEPFHAHGPVTLTLTPVPGAVHRLEAALPCAEKSARVGAGCRGCLHNAVSPGIGGYERREHPPGHPSAALLPAKLDLSEEQGAREGRGRALPLSLLREVTGEPILTEGAASESLMIC